MLTVTELKQKIQNQIAPGDDEGFLKLLQQADDRLLELGRWRWTRNKVTLTVTSDGDGESYVTLEPQYIAILGAKLGGMGADIKSEEFEYAQGGDMNISGGSGQLIDNGYMNVTAGGVTERRRVYKVSCNMEDGTPISALVHYAPALLYDPDYLDPNSTEPPEGSTDVTRCQSLAALKLCMYGIIQEDARDVSAARAYMADAHHVLEGQEHATKGGARQVINERLNGPGIRRPRSFY